MNILLWRHAEAAAGFPDHERALTEKGRLQAKRMAAWLNARLPPETLVLVSPAVRAQQTARALKRDFTPAKHSILPPIARACSKRSARVSMKAPP